MFFIFMRKRFTQFFVFGIFLTLILISFVSAGFFGDLWNKITGETVESSVGFWTQWFDVDNPSGAGDYELLKNDYINKNACENPIGIECQTTGKLDYTQTKEVVHCEVDKGLWCVNSEQQDGRCDYDYRVRFDCQVEEETNCVESIDCGEDYFIEGTRMCDQSNNVVQYKLVFSCLEGSCSEEKVLKRVKSCEGSCLNGECVVFEEVEPLCEDSDGGKNSFEKGTVIYENRSFEDVCEDFNYVQEWYCLDEKPNDRSIECENGCEQGACLEEINESGEGETNETEENETEYFGNYSYCMGNLCTLFVGEEVIVGNHSFSIGDIAGNFVDLTVDNLMTNDSAYSTGPIALRGPKGLDERRYIVLVNSWYYGEDSDQNFIQFEFFVSNLEQGDSYCLDNYCKLYESDRAIFDAGDFTFDMGIYYKEEFGLYDIYPHLIDSGYLDNETALSFYSTDWYPAQPILFTTTHVHVGETHNLTTFFFDEETPFVFTVDEVHPTHDILGNAIAQGESYVSFNYSYNVESKKRVTISQGTSGEIRSSAKSLNEELLDSFSENIDKEISCNSGCLFENNCVPICYRVEDKYCSFGGEMFNQKFMEENCDNNCECNSNLCVDGKCVSGSLWQKILVWFDRFSR
jgi:hypothetical protein